MLHSPRLWPLLFTFVMSAMVANCATAATPSPATPLPESAALTLTTERVVAFKDGYALFVKKAKGRADDQGRVFTDAVPDQAVLGTFWAMSDAPLTLRTEVSEARDLQSTEAPAVTMAQLLQANIGVPLTLYLKDSEQNPVQATVLSVLEEKPDPESFYVGAEPTTYPVVGYATYALIAREEGQTLLPIESVVRIDGEALATTFERTEVHTAKKKRLIFELGDDHAGDQVEIRLLYFRDGLQWTPTYQLVGAGDEAKLSLQAEISNHAEDLVGVEVDLVVGVPNFRFKDRPSPVALQQVATASLQSYGNDYSNMQVSNAIYSQQYVDWNGAGDIGAAFSDDLSLSQGTAMSGTKDLFVYHAGSLSLTKGNAALLPLWSDEVSRRDLFTFDIHHSRDLAGYYDPYGYGSYGSPLNLSENKVWRQFELKNSSKTPWTTGPAMLMEGELPLGQELLTYTPSGGKALIPVTVAVDVRGSYQEEEIARNPGALVVNDISYTEVVKKGEVVLSNFTEEDISVRISLSTGGKSSEISDKGESTTSDFDYYDWSGNAEPLNNHSDIVWEVEVKSGKSRTLSSTFTYYVR